MTRRKRTYAAGASESGAPGWPEFAAWTASIASVRIVSMQRRSTSVRPIASSCAAMSAATSGSGSPRLDMRAPPPAPPGHRLERQHLVVGRMAGGAELRQPLRDDLLLRLAHRLEERARVELLRARLDRLAQRSRDRETAVGVDVHLADAVADALLDLLDRHPERRLELAAGSVDPVDEILRDARGAVHDHVRVGQLLVDLLDEVHCEDVARRLLRELVRAVARADSDRERVDAGLRDEVDRLVGIG